MSTIFIFENTEFEVVNIKNIHNAAWVSDVQIAGALGYENPSTDIANLYDCSADEFTPEMTQVLLKPGLQKVRVFSPRGCYLLGMLARTEKAKAFRQWTLDVLDGAAIAQGESA